MFGIGLITFAVYILTLSPGVDPGTSAGATGKVLGFLPSVPVTHPLWLLLSRAAAAIPAFDAVLRLNLFSAVCGSLTAAWLCRVTKRVIFECIREAPAVRLVPAGEETLDNKEREVPDGDVMEHVLASLGGVVAAFSFAFCAPFWIASASLHTQPFTLLLTVFTLDILACYHFTGKTSACVVAMFLFGLGLAESVVFVALAPFVLVLVLLDSIRYDQISESFLLLMLSVCLAGLAANLALLVLLSDLVPAANMDSLFRLMAGLARSHADALMRGLPKTGWLLVVFQTTAPLLLALVSLRRFFSHQNEIKQWKWLAANTMVTAFLLACLVNLQGTAWSMAREGGHLPIIPCLSVALASGVLFTYWGLVLAAPVYNQYYELASAPLGLRLLGFGMCVLLGGVTMLTLHTNANDADGRKAAFADRIADVMLAQAGPALCFMTDGTLDLNMLIRNRLKGSALTFLPCPQETGGTGAARTEKRLPFRLTLPGKEPLPSPSLETFVEHWLHENPKGCGQVAVAGNPLLWQRAGLTPVPNGLVYGGTDDERKLDVKDLLARNRECWRQVAPLLAEDRTMRPELRLIQTRVRVLASRVANDLGVLLEDMGDVQGAESAYTEALQLDGENICSVLNRHGLRLTNGNPAQAQDFASQIEKLSAKPDLIVTFDATVSRYGRLSHQDADIILPAVMLNYKLGSQPPAFMLRLLEKWLGAFRSFPLNPDPAITRAARAGDTAPDTMLSQALAMLLDGQTAKAETRLRSIIGTRPNNLSAWALLAEVLMARGDLKEVRDVILPSMRASHAVTGTNDCTLVDMTQGCLLMRTVPPQLPEARACFERALSQTPTLIAASDELLRADRLLGDAARLEADALRIVKHTPDHATANAILGSLLLGQKRYIEAESFLRHSLKVYPAAGTLNDLAELFRQQNKLAEAEQHARLAIRLAPDFYQAWDTLGNILVEGKRLDEAYGPLRCALALNSTDPRLLLSLTRLWIRQGRLLESRHIMSIAARLIDDATPRQTRDEYNRLNRELASAPSKY